MGSARRVRPPAPVREKQEYFASQSRSTGALLLTTAAIGTGNERLSAPYVAGRVTETSSTGVWAEPTLRSRRWGRSKVEGVIVARTCATPRGLYGSVRMELVMGRPWMGVCSVREGWWRDRVRAWGSSTVARWGPLRGNVRRLQRCGRGSLCCPADRRYLWPARTPTSGTPAVSP